MRWAEEELSALGIQLFEKKIHGSISLIVPLPYS